MTITVGSLFSGCGGFDLGFEQAGCQLLWQCEIDSTCNAVLARHWPDVPRYSDVREVGAHNLAPVDIITFGSPCQDLSVAGKRAGLGGERSGLFWEAVRIIREMREATQGQYPTFAVMENVPGLISSKEQDVVHGCVCGWTDRRRGLHLRGNAEPNASQPDGGSRHRSRHDEQRIARAPIAPTAIRREDLQQPASDRALGSGLAMASTRRRGSELPATDYAAFDVEARAGEARDTRSGIASNARAAWQDEGGLDRGGVSDVPNGGGDDSGTEPKGTGTGYSARNRGRDVICHACGRRVGQAATRPVFSDGLAVVLWGLAQCGAVSAGWRVLDAQYFGVPQRRRRVFLVADFRAERAAEILALADSLRWYPAPRRTQGETVAPTLESGANRTGGTRPPGTTVDTITSLVADVARPLASGARGGSGYRNNADTADSLIAHTLRPPAKGSAWRGDGADNLIAFSTKDHGADAGDVAPTLRAMNHDESHPNGGGQVAIFEARYARNGRGAPGDVCPPLKAQSGQTGKGDASPLLAAAHIVRRLTPTEAERLMAFPDNWTAYGSAGPIADSHRYRMLGNSVVVNVAAWLARRIVAHWEDTP